MWRCPALRFTAACATAPATYTAGTPKLSQNTTNIASSEILHGPPATTDDAHRISFVSRHLIYGTNSARAVTHRSGEFHVLTLYETHDFRIDLRPFPSILPRPCQRIERDPRTSRRYSEIRINILSLLLSDSKSD